ncbi:modification methylase DpnIIA [Peptococcaceae bacterium CEB3]|nr:modification methylase DpnIIA [Peptococcaceae bacterium CEB3]
MIYDEENLSAVHEYLCGNSVNILSGDFAETLKSAASGDFVYLDPPYDPVSKTASFVAYSQEGFGTQEQVRLKATVDDLTKRGCKVLVSNSDTLFIRNLYRDYQIATVKAARAINSNGGRRQKITELLITNY